MQPHDTVYSEILQKKIAEARSLYQYITAFSQIEQKAAYLSSLESVSLYLERHHEFDDALKTLPQHYQYCIKVALALNQGPIIFDAFSTVQHRYALLESLARHLSTIDHFYAYMGGLIGYHLETLERMYAQFQEREHQEPFRIEAVPYTDIRTETKEVKGLVAAGLKAIETMAEVYVVGGAGDRFSLKDKDTNMPLPVACLEFCGKTLLTGLVRDLEAREHLYYKLTSKEIYTPILLMTSLDKNNDKHIQAICEREGYFGRPKSSIYRILQPLAPVITVEGNWAVINPLELVLKPGGHGVIWKQATDFGAFDWLEEQHKQFLIVRQINNPLAGLDYGLLALAGYGTQNKKAFGFESCPRRENMSEGMNILKCVSGKDGEQCTVSNIEYTEFAARQKKDPGFARNHCTCSFPANTNILFASIPAIRNASKQCPIPGLIVNMKQTIETAKGKVPCARLESSMQNIADAIWDTRDTLRTFVLLNDRSKILSVAKRAYDGTNPLETPDSSFFDLITENIRLLKEVCGFQVPAPCSLQEFLEKGPSALFLYHPSLGPLYSIIKQKIHKGSMAQGAELQIEAQEVAMKEVHIEGSLLIVAENVTGVVDPLSKIRAFSHRVGSVELEKVHIKNKGIDSTTSTAYWKNELVRKESCRIILEGHSECIVKDVTISGDFEVRVHDGERVTITEGLEIRREPLLEAKVWKYHWEKDNEIRLTR